MIGAAQNFVILIGGDDPTVRLASQSPTLTEAVHASLEKLAQSGEGIDCFHFDLGRLRFASLRIVRDLLDDELLELDFGLHIVIGYE